MELVKENIKEIVLKNIGPFKDVTLDFDLINYVIGNNGSGKTVILDADAFVRYGIQPSTPDSLSNAFSWLNDEDAYICGVYDFENGDTFKIIRHFQRKGAKQNLEIYLNGEDLNPSKLVTDGTKVIEKYLGSQERYLIISYMGSDNPKPNSKSSAKDITMVSPSDRKRILIEFLDVDNYDNDLERVSNELKEYKNKLESYTYFLNTLEKKVLDIKELEIQISGIEEEISELNNVLKSKNIIDEIKDFKKQKEAVQTRIDSMNRLLILDTEPTEEEIDMLKENEIKDISKDIEELNKLSSKLAELNNTITGLESDKKVLENTKKNLKSKTELLKLLEDPFNELCKRCELAKDAYKANDEIAEKCCQIEDIDIELESYSKKLKEIQDKAAKLENRISKQNRLCDIEKRFENSKKDKENKKLIDELKKEASNILEEIKDRTDKIDVYIHNYDLDLDHIKSKIEDKNKELSNNKDKLAVAKQAKKDITSAKSNITKTENHIMILENLKRAFDIKEGIPVYDLENSIQSLSEEATDILRKVFKKNWRIRFDTQKEGRTNVKETLDITVEREGNIECDILRLSGAQRKITRLAIRLAMAKMSNAGVIIIDEVLDTLDSYHTSMFLDILVDYLGSNLQIIQSTHSKNIRAFHNIINLERENELDYTKIKGESPCRKKK